MSVDDPLGQLNAALLADGIRISVEAGVAVEKPIGFMLDDHAIDQAVITQTRVLIDVGQGAAAQFVEAHVSSGEGEHFANIVVQIDLARDASADYVRIQQRARHHILTGRLSADLTANSTLGHFAFDLGGSLIRNDIVVAISTNYGHVSEDIMNRSLPIHLDPVGDISARKSAIGNPRLEFLPKNKEKIDAEFHGMIARWVKKAKPLDG